ncbi:GPI alpha-1,2-mannosyltransferase 4 [Lissotriton helveticus]
MVEPMETTKILWAVLALFRIAWCLFPQTGYIHPDEFFQSPEVMAGDILDLQVYRPWEFLSNFPCRTALFPLMTSGATFWIMKSLTHVGFLNSFINSYSLLVLPRLCLTLFSFILDYSVYQVAPVWGVDRWKAMVLLAGSYVTLVFYTRTFSNVIEGVLFALLLMLVSLEAPKTSSARKSIPNKTNYSSQIGIILVAGCFNRPTFLAFAVIPVLYWAAKNTITSCRSTTITLQVLKCVPAATATALIFIVVDTVYFIHEGPVDHSSLDKVNQPQSFKLWPQNLVFTPFNFLKYNVIPHNLAQHGSHSRSTHFVINGAMLFGVLHLSAAVAASKVLRRGVCRILERKHSKARDALPLFRHVLLLFYFVPLALLSLFPHQEPRFLIPLILPLVLWSAPESQKIQWKSIIVLFNLLGAIVFGCLHQGGLIPCLSQLEHVIHTKESLNNPSHYTLLFTHTYMPPRYLLNIKNQETSVDVIDMAGTEEKQFCQKVGNIAGDMSSRNTETPQDRIHHLYIITPGTFKPALENCGFVVKNETLFFPHLSMEDPPHISVLFSDKWLSQLGLYILQLELHALPVDKVNSHRLQQPDQPFQ